MSRSTWKQWSKRKRKSTPVDFHLQRLEKRADRLLETTPKRPQATTALFKADFTGTRIDGVLNFDGSCYPNPGNSKCGFILRYSTRIIERTVDLGYGTNNTAEYHGLLHGMRAAFDAGVTHLEVYGDSQIVIRGVARMRLQPGGKPHLEKLKGEAIELAKKFAAVDFNWIPREQNTEADMLSTA